MGVNPTLPNYKTLTFDNSNSATYGVYLTGEAVFNAPERAVEMVSIPGRNGAFALDKGHFENIEVKYRAGIFADTQADFANAISNFRNMLCSKVGYCRLTDDYNPNEYRMAIYKSGLEVEHKGLLTGEFDIIFECKPQRFLTSGETKSTVASGGTITNPTLFESHPQLQVYGYGDIDLGGQEVTVENVPIGEIVISNSISGNLTKTQNIDISMLESGDSFTISGIKYTIQYNVFNYPTNYINGNTCSVTSTTNASVDVPSGNTMYSVASVNIYIDNATFSKGTSSSHTASAVYVIGYNIGGAGTTSVTANCTISYNGNSRITYSVTLSPGTIHSDILTTEKMSINSIVGQSTKSALGTPIYIDLDIGEAYNIIGGSAVSVNNAVQLPAELPVLPSGATTVTFDNTITKLDIVPRWWKV